MRRRLLGVVVGAALLALFATSASGGGTGREFAGTWRPPPAAGDPYKVTNAEEGTDTGTIWRGKMVDGILLCQGAPDIGDDFWTAQQTGALGGAGLYEGHTFIFRQAAPGEPCEARSVRAKFWSPANDVLRICPAPFDAPENEPAMDFNSPVDQAGGCGDFRRTTPPDTSETKPHPASDYIGKIKRDSNRCPKFGPREYSAVLKYVADDPANRVDVFVKRTKTASFKPYNVGGAGVNHGFVPTSNQKRRVLSLEWVKKGKSWWRFRVKTQKGKSYKKTKFFEPCHI
jgi:hypothetical protein